MSEPDNRCSMQHCGNSFDTGGKMFFNFPTDLNLCAKWIENCGRQDFVEILSYGGALPFILKYVCQDHFCEEDFLEENDLNKGLKEEAIPRPLIKSESVIILPEELQPYFVHPKEDQHNTRPQDAAPESEIKMNIIKLEPEDPSEFLRGNLKTIPNPKPSFDPEWQEVKRTAIREKRAAQMARRRQTETPEQRAKRLERDRIRNRTRREQERELSLTDPEVEEKLRIKKMREALLAAIKRHNESPEEKATRREREKLRVREKRRQQRELSKSDPDLAVKLELQKLKFRVTVALRRQNETPEQRDIRLKKDRYRVRERRMRDRELSKEDAHIEEQLGIKRLKERILKALKKQKETPEERARRLEKQRVQKSEERRRKLMSSFSEREFIEMQTCDYPETHTEIAAFNIKSEPQNIDLDHKFLPVDQSSNLRVTIDNNELTNDQQQSTNMVNTVEKENNNGADKIQTTAELELLRNQISEILKHRKKQNNTNAKGNNNLSLLDNRLDSECEESTDDENSDDSEYERYLESVNSDDSQGTGSLEPECVVNS